MSGAVSVPTYVLDGLVALVREHAPSCDACENRRATVRVEHEDSLSWWSACDECSAAPTLHCGACGCLDHAAPGGQCPLCSSTEPTVAAQAAALRWARDRKVTT